MSNYDNFKYSQRACLSKVILDIKCSSCKLFTEAPCCMKENCFLQVKPLECLLPTSVYFPAQFARESATNSEHFD